MSDVVQGYSRKMKGACVTEEQVAACAPLYPNRRSFPTILALSVGEMWSAVVADRFRHHSFK